MLRAEIVVDNLAGGLGQISARGTALHHDGDDDLRVVIRGEQGEDGVGLLVRRAHLGGAGLGAHLHRQVAQVLVYGALGVVGHLPHAPLHRLHVGGVESNVVFHLGLLLIHRLRVVAGLDGLEQVRHEVIAAVEQGNDIVGQLKGGNLGVVLTDGGVEQVAAVPLHPQGLAGGRSGHIALHLGQFDTSVLSQAEQGSVLVNLVNAQPVAHGVKVDVAGVPQGVGQILPPVVASVLAVDPALGMEIAVGVVLLLGELEAAGVLNFLRGRGQSLLQRGDGHQRLEGGTGIVKLLGGSVEQRGQLGVAGQLIVKGDITVDPGQIVGGIGGHGQDLPRLDALHHHRAAPGILRLQSLDGVGQNLLHLLLEAEVQSEQNVVPRLGDLLLSGLGVDAPVLADHLSAGGQLLDLNP